MYNAIIILSGSNAQLEKILNDGTEILLLRRSGAVINSMTGICTRIEEVQTAVNALCDCASAIVDVEESPQSSNDVPVHTTFTNVLVTKGDTQILGQPTHMP